VAIKKKMTPPSFEEAIGSFGREDLPRGTDAADTGDRDDQDHDQDHDQDQDQDGADAAEMPIVTARAPGPSATGMAAVLQAMQDLQEQNAQLLQRMEQMENRRLAPAAPAGGLPNLEQMDLRPLDEGSIHASFESYFWIRMKPYNPDLGHLRKGCPLNELTDRSGRPRFLRGGTGRPGDVPQWERVSKTQALRMSRYRQRDEVAHSPMLLDIVTEKQKEAIDLREAAMRAGMLGISGMDANGNMIHASSQVQVNRGGGVSATANAPAPRVVDGAQVPSEQVGAEPPRYWEVQRNRMDAAVRRVEEGLGGDMSMGDVSMGGRLP